MVQDLRVLRAREDMAPPPGWPEGAGALGARLAVAALHEFYAAAEPDAPGATGFALLAGRALGRGRFVWVRHIDLDREAGAFYPPGAAALGVDPASFLFVRAQRVDGALQAALEAARCAGAATILVEFRGAARVYDLVASRRLACAARDSGARVFLVRSGAPPAPSAAQTRWLVRCARSRVLAANAPGGPAFDLALLRDRRGREGFALRVEWNRERGWFEDCDVAGAAPRPCVAPLSGAVVSFPVGRPGAPDARARAG